MRFHSTIGLLLGAVAVAPGALAQTSANTFELYSGCTVSTSRGTLGANTGDILLKVPASHFAGVGHDPAGTGTRLTGLQALVQDQNASTQEQFSFMVRADNAGAPDCSPSGVLLQTSPMTSPIGSGVMAWLVTSTFATPSAVLPLCDTYYYGANVTAAPNWSADGLSFHISSGYTLNGAQSDNPAPTAPTLGFDNAGGTVAIPRGPRSIRFNLQVESAVLNLGNTDHTLTAANCLTQSGNRSWGLGGLWPGCTGIAGARNDGLDCRVRNFAARNGIFTLFLGTPLCPGLPLGPVASGALYLNPAGLFAQVSAGVIDSTGTGIGTILPAGNPIAATLVNRAVDFQAFTIGGTFALPGHLSNRASVTYMCVAGGSQPPTRTATLYAGTFPEGEYEDLVGAPGQPIALPSSLGPIHSVSWGVTEGYCPFDDFSAVSSATSTTLDITRPGIYFIDVAHGTDPANTKFVVNVNGGAAKAWAQAVGVPGPVPALTGFDLYVAEAGPAGRVDFVDCAAQFYGVPAANRYDTVEGLNALIDARKRALGREISVCIIGHGSSGYVSMGATSGRAAEFIGRNQAGALGRDAVFLAGNRGKVTRVAFFSCSVASGNGIQFMATLANGLKAPTGPQVTVNAYNKCVWAWCALGAFPAQIGLSLGGGVFFWQSPP